MNHQPRRFFTFVFAVFMLTVGCAHETQRSAEETRLSELAPCAASTPIDATCAIEILSLRPTQMAIGSRVVDRRKTQLAGLAPTALDAAVVHDAAPAVRGPGGRLYMIDRHHFITALYRTGRAQAAAILIRDLSGLSSDQFRSEMVKRGWVHLYDEQGRGPRRWSELPRDVSRLKDDPYRSLAADVRDRGGFARTEIPFAEFHWANFFRTRIQVGTSTDDYDKALVQALALAHEPAAKSLPGFTALEPNSHKLNK